VVLRGGARFRTLPFGVAGDRFGDGTGDGAETIWAKERAWSLGAGIPLANVGGLSRAALDLAVQNASRSGVPGISERAWTLSVGLAIRP
jgi:hypothetical protein